MAKTIWEDNIKTDFRNSVSVLLAQKREREREREIKLIRG
jgi:hypothetical protein